MFSFDEAVAAVNGTVVNRKGVIGGTLFITGVSTDVRTIEEGNLFFALKKDTFDGNDHAATAMARGACAVVVSSMSKVPDYGIGIVVKDVSKALAELAEHYRYKIGAKVITVTGTRDTDTYCSMISEALAPSYKIWSARNSLPGTILSAPQDTRVLIIGVDPEEDIRTARPDIAVIADMGSSDSSINKETIRNECSGIINSLAQNGILIVNADDGFLFDHIRNIIPINNGLIAVSADDKLNGSVKNCPVCVNASDVRMNNGMHFDLTVTMGDRKNVIRDIHTVQEGDECVPGACYAFMCASLLNADTDKAVESLSKGASVYD